MEALKTYVVLQSLILIYSAKTSNHPLPLSEPFSEVISFAKDNQVKLVIVGPEQPLVDGISDYFKSVGISCFGPSSKASLIEASKVLWKYSLFVNCSTKGLRKRFYETT
jgi:phosphoribosylamine-glycine ligase